ncbi:N-sulfoglucosamine sulfohydrolase-like protein [Dinothrombium tinctorium]|uniref:N-sulfoglucosamine sulfohydrolase-like protein n=1 Tax=Dinothrombium tinctorium TaxID=1965070 RepID=A0A3S3PJ34_9ACAR|nr:N-sulfoglucosamine sulfohydrolase-like protein [Dinothrombium tinctorium]RWS10885.1 N-sulfoglucosamine sulfohydrolase-like protein [Dinothrombium tinctorium]
MHRVAVYLMWIYAFTTDPGLCLDRNVLIILADDFGLETPVYNNTLCKTPNLERLAKRSVTFQSAYTSVSSCSPSRAALLTGLPSHENGMFGLHHSMHNFNSFQSVLSLSKILKRHKIKTGIIGKKHVGPRSVYPFDFERTEENSSILQVGRNITRIKLLVRHFLSNAKSPFFLYIGFHDPHRCGHTHPEYGNFCENFGSGKPGMGLIPDWKPIQYDPNTVDVPYFMPDTKEAREDIAAYYTTISRLDQVGVSLVLDELKEAGYENNTLVIFTSDNGPSFPNGRTNVYEPAVKEPFLISNPFEPDSWGKVESSAVSLLDVLPTVLDWFAIKFPKYKIFKKRVKLTGKSLLSFTNRPFETTMSENNEIYMSHNLHEVTMYYPMRAVRVNDYKLIHNLNYRAPFPIDQDFYLSPTFQGILNRTARGEPLRWFKNLTIYYQRPEWELFDLKHDYRELNNIYEKESIKNVTNLLKALLHRWMQATNDPWLCSPDAVLEENRSYEKPTCLPLFNR